MKNFKATGDNIVNVYERKNGAAGMWVHRLVKHEEYFETREEANHYAFANFWDNVKVERIA